MTGKRRVPIVDRIEDNLAKPNLTKTGNALTLVCLTREIYTQERVSRTVPLQIRATTHNVVSEGDGSSE